MKQFVYFSAALFAPSGLASSYSVNDAVVSGLTFGSFQNQHRISRDEISFRPNHLKENSDDNKPANFPASRERTTEMRELEFLHCKNIRYAQQPVGELRFAPPVAPEPVEGKLLVFNGVDGHSCRQAAPQWLIDLLKSQGKDWKEEFRTETDGEDCLFLDIAMPNYTEAKDRFPVLVWIYGGGYDEFLFLLRNGRN